VDAITQSMADEKRQVAANSVFAAVAITGFKAVVGITTGSLGILSEALHSALDLVAAIITLVSVRVSDRPADEGHHYGHGKFENFSAFVETGLLGLTCVWIVYEAIKRLVFRGVEVEPSITAFMVMAFSIATDFWRSRALKRVAIKYDSQALEADALHFSTDIWSSCAVILGLAVVWAGRAYHLPILQIADPIAALVVAGIVMTVTWRLGRETMDALVDAAPAGLHDRVVEAVSNVPGVLSVEGVRLRRAGNRTFADVRVALARTLSFERTESFSKEVADAVHAVVPNAEVAFRAVPRVSSDESLIDQVRTMAARHGVAVRDLSIMEVGGALDIEPFLEFDGTLTLKAVHDRMTAIESEIGAEMPRVRSIVTHVAPAGAIATDAEQIHNPQLESALRVAAMEIEGVLDVHDFRIRRVGDQLDVSCHCLLADDTPLNVVHEKLVAAEQRLRACDPRLGRIVLHPEPASEG
jgi:cation diffusion facilitator family transporter